MQNPADREPDVSQSAGNAGDRREPPATVADDWRSGALRLRETVARQRAMSIYSVRYWAMLNAWGRKLREQRGGLHDKLRIPPPAARPARAESAGDRAVHLDRNGRAL